MFKQSAIAVLMPAALTLGAAAPALAQGEQTLRIGAIAEPDNEIVTRTAEHVLEERLGYDAERVQTSIALQYQGVADDSLDAMLVAWLPTTQAAYWEKYKDEVADLGVLFTGKIGWVVPDYIPESELASMDDLSTERVRERLDGRITGIDPGAGLMGKSKAAIETYGLDDYNLKPSSAAGMTAALDRAIRDEEWIVVTGWNPHWKFAKYDLRYLDDPENVFGGKEKIHALARQDLREEAPRAAAFLSDYRMPLDVLQQAMVKVVENENAEQAVTDLIEANQDLIDDWVAEAKDKPKFGGDLAGSEG